jgi:hypothetical protein
MKTIVYILLALCFFSQKAFGQVPGIDQPSPFSLGGYIKNMPAVQFNRDFSDPEFVNILHNRLNFLWHISEGWLFAAEGRNRLLYNKMFSDFPVFSDILRTDPGFIDMSWIWLDEGSWIGHTNIDRFYVDFRRENLQVRLGRQRINWGINLVSNPNDLFNTYSFFDFDYPERPGADALRVQYHLGFASRAEAAFSPGRHIRESTAAMLYSVNFNQIDLQAIAGYFMHRSATGIGWAANIGGASFKGETTFFYDLEPVAGLSRGNLVAATGVDYMFGDGTFALIELLYNGGHGRIRDEVFLITQPLRPDNIMFSEYAITLNAQRPLTTLMQAGMAIMALPDIDAFFIMPNLNYSLLTNLDLEFVAQIFAGSRDSIFGQAGSSWFISLQYSF